MPKSAVRDGRIHKQKKISPKPVSRKLKSPDLREINRELLQRNRVLYRSLEQIKKTDERLKQSEERFRLLAEGVKDYAIYLLDPEGNVVTWNVGAQRNKGYSSEEILGRHFSIFYTEEDRRTKKPWKLLRQAEETGTAEDTGFRVRKDGTRFWANIVLTALRDKSGELKGFAKVTRDVTEKMEAEMRLHEAYGQLEKKVEQRTEELTKANFSLVETEKNLRDHVEILNETNRQLEQFTYIASHDLQEPLRKIINYSERLESSMESEIQRDSFRRMQNSALRMKKVIEDLLQYSKVSKTEKLSTETIDLEQLVAEVLSDLEIMMQESAANVIVDQSCEIDANRSQIRHVFQNLITNSIKFAKKGVPPTIHIRNAAGPGGVVRISFLDNGIGFDEKYAEKIFQPFHRLHLKNEYEGTGMGLAIVQRIVMNHGGQISAHSREGDGATFVILLPQKRGRA